MAVVNKATGTASILAIVVLGSSPVLAAEPWPQVQVVHEKYSFNDVAKAGFDLPLTGRDHRPLYLLKCHSGLYEADSEFDYSGLLDCRLVSLYSKETVSSLLTDTAKQPTDWLNRGRFLTEHLRKGCETNPDWGKQRDFRLRGMDIEIAISNVRYEKLPGKDNIVQSYSVDVTVKRDSTAKTSLSATPATPAPPWFYHPTKMCDQ